MERVRRDLGEHPAGWGAIGASAQLYDILANPAPDLLLPMTSHRIDPSYMPGLNRWIPDAKRRAVHVISLVRVRRALRTPGHDPGVLNGASFEHPPKVRLALNTERGDIDSSVMANIQFPASYKPSVNVGR